MGKNQVSCNVAGCVICGDHPQEMNITYADTSLPCPSCAALRARVAVLEKVVAVAARKPNKLGGHYAMWEHDLAIALDALKEE